MVRRLLALAMVLVAVATAAPAQAQTGEPTPPNPVRRIRAVLDLTFPVVGPARYEDAFGDCRDGCNREHLGIDIFSNGWKGVPVVAAHSGIVELAEVYGKRSTCAIHIRAANGWETRYLHLNTDTPGSDDGAFTAGCAAPGVTVGSYVAAGQIIGWLGDSGNAEHNSVHVHFEIRTPKGTPVDPLRSLDRAEVVSYAMLDPLDPVAAAITVSEMVYPGGSSVAFLTTVDRLMEDGIGLPWSARMAGPVLLADGGLDAATRAELARLDPAVVVILERPGERPGALADEVATLARVVERIPFPEDAERVPAPLAEASPPIVPDAAPGFRVIVVEDGSPMTAAAAHAMSDLRSAVATVRLVQPGEVTADHGLSVLVGPERPGRLHSVYYPAGSAWQHFPVDVTNPIVVRRLTALVVGDEVSASTLTFLRSLASAPVTPYWR